ncbi:peptidase M23 [Photobacterium phosphoreum]|uniref:Peptidase M23 n=2 Tax=Photobacterium phosphoreum TaxID=659 RepID=A0A2T3JNW1_PHOPO|nr:peptidase M23 [Photobacterium phosphoreum]PSU41824.1 peptidase M23 [Photobacterium phosphoreum]PSU50724.1 peptidase M23 [Photobacterium phosphoreum]
MLMTPLARTLHAHCFHSVIPQALQFGTGLIVDLSPSSDLWRNVTTNHSFADEIVRQAEAIDAVIVIGRYAEQRLIYQDKANFSDSKNRTVHMGIDLGVAALTPVFAPIEGTVHSIANHQGDGDYGPTIILRHQLEGMTFFTLYGHLHQAAHTMLNVGDMISEGEQFTAIGTTAENGGWAPHLHLQIIENMGSKTNDYIGVVDPAELVFYRNNCPNPNLILKRNDLD